jgi:hypothetical protein
VALGFVPRPEAVVARFPVRGKTRAAAWRILCFEIRGSVLGLRGDEGLGAEDHEEAARAVCDSRRVRRAGVPGAVRERVARPPVCAVWEVGALAAGPVCLVPGGKALRWATDRSGLMMRSSRRGGSGGGSCLRI